MQERPIVTLTIAEQTSTRLTFRCTVDPVYYCKITVQRLSPVAVLFGCLLVALVLIDTLALNPYQTIFVTSFILVYIYAILIVFLEIYIITTIIWVLINQKHRAVVNEFILDRAKFTCTVSHWTENLDKQSRSHESSRSFPLACLASLKIISGSELRYSRRGWSSDIYKGLNQLRFDVNDAILDVASGTSGKNGLVLKYVVMYADLKLEKVEVIKETIENFLRS